MLICLLGPSAVGKTTMETTLQPFAKRLISTTDREMRKNESDDAYYFVSKNDFDKIPLAESTEYAGNRYGLSLRELSKTMDNNKDYVFVCDINGVKQIKDLVPCPFVSVFLNAPDEHLVRRLKERGTSEEDIQRRIKQIKQDRLNAKYCDYVVNNHDGKFDEAFSKVKSIMEKHKGDINEKVNCL